MDFYRQQHINNWNKLKTLVRKLKESDGSGDYDLHGIDIDMIGILDADKSKFFQAVNIANKILDKYKP